MASCIGCKFLYGDGSGYSNWTWMDTFLRCAKGRNPKLLTNDVEKPWLESEWPDAASDTFAPTANGRCEQYSEGKFIELDPDRDFWDELATGDREQLLAIFACELEAGRWVGTGDEKEVAARIAAITE